MSIFEEYGAFKLKLKKKKDTLSGKVTLSLFCTFLKGVYSKRYEFAPSGSKFFPFKVDPFSEG